LNGRIERGEPDPDPTLRRYLGANTLVHDGQGKSPLARAKGWWGDDLQDYLIRTRKEYFELQDHLRQQMLIGDFQKFLDLLQYSGQINGYLEEGHTFLQEAVRTGSYDFVRGLLSRGATTSIKDPKGRTALHDAARAGSAEAIGELLKRKADIQIKDNEGRTALHDVARVGLAKAIDKLFKRKADIQAKDNEGRTALHDAA
jgi:ankyrin repeat protein